MPVPFPRAWSSQLLMDWLVIEPQGPLVCVPSTGVTGRCHLTWLSHGARDMNSDS